MKYNNKKKIKIKTVQIDNKEFLKCKSGKEFKLKFITQTKPVPPVNPTDGGNRGNDVVQPPRMTVAALAEIVQAGFKSINTRLDEHDKRFDKIDGTLDDYGKRLDKIDDVLSRNNLR